jgi:hypothetical protein
MNKKYLKQSAVFANHFIAVRLGGNGDPEEALIRVTFNEKYGNTKKHTRVSVLVPAITVMELGKTVERIIDRDRDEREGGVQMKEEQECE